jgi:hypothetical protein
VASATSKSSTPATWLEQSIGEPQNEDVLHRLLSKIVVDAIELVFVEDTEQIINLKTAKDIAVWEESRHPWVSLPPDTPAKRVAKQG